MSSPTAAGRRYGGLTAEERRAARREQLVDAGLELFGTIGFAGTSIRAVLRESGLAERYFYESFDSLEGLLVAVHERIHVQLATAVRAATDAAGDDVTARTRAGLRAFVENLSTDERFVRLKLQELSGSAGDEVRRFRRRAFARYAEMLIDLGDPAAAESRGLDPTALAIALLAAIEALLDAWVAGELTTDLDGLTDHAVVIVAGAVDHLTAIR